MHDLQRKMQSSFLMFPGFVLDYVSVLNNLHFLPANVSNQPELPVPKIIDQEFQ
jgi:hypothetical protein